MSAGYLLIMGVALILIGPLVVQLLTPERKRRRYVRRSYNYHEPRKDSHLM